MGALQKKPATAPWRSDGGDGLACLNHLRFVAMKCRVKPREDLFRACALLHGEASVCHRAHAEALMRCLPEALGRSLRLHGPGTSEMSFDERWLLSLLAASLRDDLSSLAFLLQSQVRPVDRRLVAYLVQHITEGFARD